MEAPARGCRGTEHSREARQPSSTGASSAAKALATLPQVWPLLFTTTVAWGSKPRQAVASALERERVKVVPGAAAALL